MNSTGSSFVSRNTTPHGNLYWPIHVMTFPPLSPYGFISHFIFYTLSLYLNYFYSYFGLIITFLRTGSVSISFIIGPSIRLVHGWPSINTMNEWMDKLHKKSVIKVQGIEEISVTPQYILHMCHTLFPGESSTICAIPQGRHYSKGREGNQELGFSHPGFVHGLLLFLCLGTFSILERKLRCTDFSIFTKNTRCFLHIKLETQSTELQFS